MPALCIGGLPGSCQACRDRRSGRSKTGFRRGTSWKPDYPEAPVALAGWSGAHGVDVVRVHDVHATVQALVPL